MRIPNPGQKELTAFSRLTTDPDGAKLLTYLNQVHQQLQDDLERLYDVHDMCRAQGGAQAIRALIESIENSSDALGRSK